MKIPQTFIMLTCTFFAVDAFACRPPDYADIDIIRNVNAQKPAESSAQIIFHMRWDKWAGPVNCATNAAIEFEFLIDTHPLQKCFAQPVGGKDESANSLDLRDFTDFGYTDVWNYHFDYTAEEAHEILTEYCGEIDGKWANRVTLFDFSPFHQLADEIANFGFGTTAPNQIELGKLYTVTYPLEIPLRPECDDIQAGWGYVQINMAVITNTCVLDEIAYSCPHLLGFDRCANRDKSLETRYVLQHRLCAPTGGIWEIHEPNASYNSRGGGYCIDEDNDGIFANSPSVQLFGHNLLDCADNNPGTTQGGKDNTELKVLYPQPPYRFGERLATVFHVKDPDGIQVLTVTVDESERPECRSRKEVSLDGKGTDYLLTLDLKPCLGDQGGEHYFKVWAKDRCGNIHTTSHLKFEYVPDLKTCSNSMSGQIVRISDQGNAIYSLEDADGLIFRTLAVNGIDEDRCKFRKWIPSSQIFQPQLYDENDAPMNLAPCLLNEDLSSVQLWGVDACGNASMVHNFKL